jgi:hypothetical protein
LWGNTRGGSIPLIRMTAGPVERPGPLRFLGRAPMPI